MQVTLQNWHKKGLLRCHGLHGVECIFAWNMSALDANGRFKVNCHEFFAALSEEMLEYINTHGEDVVMKVNIAHDEFNGHEPVPMNHHDRMVWTVCKLKEDWMKSCNILRVYGEGSEQQCHMSICTICGMSDHSLSLSWHRKYFS